MVVSETDNPRSAKASIELKGFPMPPTANHLYATISRRGGGHLRVKSKEAKEYERECKVWAIKHSKDLADARLMTIGCGKGVALRIDHLYHFKRSAVITKEGLPKKRDIFNLQKALHDALAELLGVDDRYFWEGSVERGYTGHPSFPENVDLLFHLIEF